VTAAPLHVSDGIATLALLDDQDVPWISALIDEMEAAVGRSWREYLERIAALPIRAAPVRRAAVVHALRSCVSGQQSGTLKAAQIRRHLFGKAALDAVSRDERLAAVASLFSTTPEQIEVAMWADLTQERIVTMPDGRPTPRIVAAAANLSMIQRALMRCYRVRLRVTGNARAIVSSSTLRGLMTTAQMHDNNTVELCISGPLAVFHRTTVYGRALGAIASQLAWCETFVLEAECEVREQPALLRIAAPVLLPPGKASKRYDSKLEARFSRDFSKAAPDWRLLREPTAVDAGGRLAFPDFLVEHRHDATRRWWIEIVGFWTADYLAQKFATYRAAQLQNIILCIDDRRSVDAADIPIDAKIVRFRKSIAVEEILAILNRQAKASH
jgi:predicted nuclease of restriction endonuclease-like RecB superfamily